MLIDWFKKPADNFKYKSVCASIETLVAICLYFFIAYRLDNNFLLISALFVTPAMMLRSEKSTNLAIEKFNEYWNKPVQQESTHGLLMDIFIFCAVFIFCIYGFTYISQLTTNANLLFSMLLGISSAWIIISFSLFRLTKVKEKYLVSHLIFLSIFLFLFWFTSLLVTTLVHLKLTNFVGFFLGYFMVIDGRNMYINNKYNGLLTTITKKIFDFIEWLISKLYISSSILVIIIYKSWYDYYEYAYWFFLFCSIFFWIRESKNKLSNGIIKLVELLRKALLYAMKLIQLIAIYTPSLFGIWLAVLYIRILSTLSNFMDGVKAFPVNCWNITFSDNFRIAPEIIPNISTRNPSLSFKGIISLMHNKAHVNNNVLHLFVLLVFFAPTFFYRMALKSIMWFCLPVLYLAKARWHFEYDKVDECKLFVRSMYKSRFEFFIRLLSIVSGVSIILSTLTPDDKFKYFSKVFSSASPIISLLSDLTLSKFTIWHVFGSLSIVMTLIIYFYSDSVNYSLETLGQNLENTAFSSRFHKLLHMHVWRTFFTIISLEATIVYIVFKVLSINPNELPNSLSVLRNMYGPYF